MPQPAEDAVRGPEDGRPRLMVYARRALVAAQPCAGPAVLLEGAWEEPHPTDRWSLDQTLDGRFDWLDRRVEACATELIRYDQAHAPPGRAPLWLGALELRYHLVKLLRVCAFFTHVRPLATGERVYLAVEMPRDTDYVDLVSQLCAAAGARLTLYELPGPPSSGPRFPPNRTLRRWLGHLAERIPPWPERQPGQAHVVLCGNPRVLDPLVRPLMAGGLGVWWLYDRFALRTFLTWHWRGVGQLVCNASQGDVDGLHASVPERFDALGVDLASAVRRHATHWLRAHGARQSRLAQAIEAHFRRLRPVALVLDEDATPLTRAAIAAARTVGARSLVVQHGAPCCRFGFAPLAADAICVWGRSAKSQLLRWGVPENQILVTGSPYHEQLRKRLSPRGRAPVGHEAGYRFLLLATIAPRDERPDALALHLTRQSYADLIRAALDGALAAGCRDLVVKLHPRAGRDPVLSAALAARPALRVRVVRRGRLERLLRGIDCVLSCGSSAGVDATLSGVPVIQVLPAGASDFLSRESWGLAGTVRTADELAQRAGQVLSPTARPPVLDPDVFGSFDHSATARIVEEILAPHEPAAPVPEPRSSVSLHPSAFR
jgi:hypothetical protein